jgi:hypothetical protein
MLPQSLHDVADGPLLKVENEMRNAEKTSEIRELTQDDLMLVSGGFIVGDIVNIVNIAARYLGHEVAKAARVTTLPAAGNGDCGPNHNGV